MSARPGGYGCWVGGCAHLTEYVVANPATPLVRPVESCNDHLGDLLGNASKAALRADESLREVTLRITRLAP